MAQGRGRDYRPNFDVEAYADEWGLPIAQAEALVEDAWDPSHVIDNRCELGQAYFLLCSALSVPQCPLFPTGTDVVVSEK